MPKSTITFVIGAVTPAKQNKKNRVFKSVKAGSADNAPWYYCEESDLFPLFEKGKTITVVLDTYKDFTKIVDVVTEGERQKQSATDQHTKPAPSPLDRIEQKIDRLLEIAEIKNLA